jgi:hypothetical protein
VLERAGPLAGGVAGACRRLAELAERRDQLGLALEALRERVLAPAAEHVLDPARHLGGALGRTANLAERRRALRVDARPAGRVERLDRIPKRLPDPLDAGAGRVVSGLRTGRVRELGGQRSERRAAALDASQELGAAAGESLGANADPLMRGADRGQPAPGLGALALALGELLLDRGAALGDLGELGVEPCADLAGGDGALLGRGELVVVAVQLGGQQAGAQLGGLALEPGVDVGRLGLALQRSQRLARLTLDVERAVEVVLGALELQLGAAAALSVLAEPGRFLDQQAAFARRGEHDLLDPALADHRVHLAAEVGVGEDLDHVGEPRPRSVDPVGPLSPALEPAKDRNGRKTGHVLGWNNSGHLLGFASGGAGWETKLIVGLEHDLDLGVAARADALAAGVDHVLHRLAADAQRALLAERPEHGVGDVGLAAAVRPDDHADARAEDQLGAFGKGLEALDRDRAEMHIRV